MRGWRIFEMLLNFWVGDPSWVLRVGVLIFLPICD